MNFMIKKMMERVGSYFYMFPELNQGRRVLWDGMDKSGFKFLDHFPKDLIKGEPNKTEMKITFTNGSIFQVTGSDRFDSLMGTNPVGIVFSEYALSNPSSWGFFRQILAENGGWSIMNGTPRGENHLLDIYNIAKADPAQWFSQIVTVDDTHAIPQEVLDQERREIIALYGNDSLFRQEYYCDFTVPIAGAYYAHQIQQAYTDGRVTHVAYDPRYRVDTWWDLGVNDTQAIWFTQSVGTSIHVIDYYANSGAGLEHYVKVMQDKGYIYGRHVGPHDIKVREWSSGRTRIATASGMGIDFEAAPLTTLKDGIDLVRMAFVKCWFDKDKCKDGLNALKNYHRTYDDVRRAYLNSPYHDWSSNGADAFRTMAVAIDVDLSVPRPRGDRYQREKSIGSYHLNAARC